MKEKLQAIIAWLIILLSKIAYKHYDNDIYYIKGTGKDEGIYFMFTMKKSTAKNFEEYFN